MTSLRLLAISGSLRKHSYNTAALHAAKAVSPKHVDIHIASIDRLPLFNPDLESTDIFAVTELKSLLSTASGLIIASPEYAHGISGPLKNALDWLVSGVEFPDKPIMLINTSPRASHAQAALKAVLATMSGDLIHDANITLPLLGSDMDRKDILNSTEMVMLVNRGLETFEREIRLRQALALAE